MEATSKQNNPQLINILMYEEFHRNQNILQNKITKLSLEIRNLSLGKYIPPKKNLRRLKYSERNYKDILVVHIRKIELENMNINQLRLHASIIGIKNIGKIY